jgi:cyclopropane fatty-acyl-phospholipid synthase-like methyltransferase
MKTLMERASRLTADGIFLGGPAELFETGGRKMLITLLSQGLTPTSKVLDIGCGCLRGGYWLIHFLDSGCYFGIEPNTKMLEGGIRVLLEPGLEDLKKPRFDHNADFDFTVFQEKFDFLVARSIWTHASKKQIQTMLDGFVSTTTGEGFFLTSYWKPTWFKRDYKGTEGRQKTAHHSLRWIQTECANRGLVAEEIKEKAYNFGSQTWIRIKPRAA